MTPIAATDFRTILLIDSSQRDQTTVGLLTNRKLTVCRQPVRAQELPVLIEKLLKKTGRRLETVSAVAVVNCPGSMTGTRIGATYANTWRWLTAKPIMEITTGAWTKSGVLAPQHLKPTNLIKPRSQ